MNFGTILVSVSAATTIAAAGTACEFTTSPNRYSTTYLRLSDLESVVYAVDKDCGIDSISTDGSTVTIKTQTRVCIPETPGATINFPLVAVRHGMLDILSPHFVYVRSPNRAELDAGIHEVSAKCGGVFVTMIERVAVPPSNEALLGVQKKDCYASELSPTPTSLPQPTSRRPDHASA